MTRLRFLLALALALPAAFLALLAVPPALAQDAAELTVRVNRLENQARQLSGQIEQLQFENRRLADQLRRFQEDVEFRLGQSGQSGQRPQGAAPGQAGQAQPAQTPRPRRNDAFDPNAQPASPGAPRALGQAEATPGSGAPVDLNSAARPSQQAAAPAAARQGYDAALAALNAREFERAEAGFREFLQANPRSRLVPAATYQLGESFFRRSQHREAAEQFLKVTTDHADSGIAPDAMLRLGMSLAALGAREQACATFARLGQRYPSASETVRNGVAREQRRARCEG